MVQNALIRAFRPVDCFAHFWRAQRVNAPIADQQWFVEERDIVRNEREKLAAAETALEQTQPRLACETATLSER